MPIVAPGYLSSHALPYVADIFFHERITYFLPTGFTPQEVQSVADFPVHCKAENIALPSWVWEFFGLYFANTEDALNCASILEPLRKDRVQIVATAYSRDRAAIDRCRDLLFEHPALLAKIRHAQLDQRLVARERLCCIKRHSFQNPTLAQQSCASCRARFFLDMDFLSKEICFCNRAS